LRPAVNTFNYPTYFLMLPLRSLREQGSGHWRAPPRRPELF